MPVPSAPEPQGWRFIGVAMNGRRRACRGSCRRLAFNTVAATLALFPGLTAATPQMGRDLVAGAGGLVCRAFSRASGIDVGSLAAETGAAELLADRAWELATIATEMAATAACRARQPRQPPGIEKVPC